MAKRSLRLPARYKHVEKEPNIPIYKRHLTARGRFMATVRLFFRRLGEAQIDQAAAALAYYAILSLFPTALLVINILPHLGLRFTGLSNVLSQLIPGNVLATIHPVLHDLAAHPSTTWLGIGAVLTLWAASLGIASLKSAYNRAYKIQANVQNFILARVVSMVMMVVLVIAVIGTMIIFAFGQQFIEWLTAQLSLPSAWLDVFLTWRWPATVGILVVALIVVDYFLPNARMKFWTITPGVVFTTAGWLVLSQVFSWYMQYFGKTFSTYGTLGAFIVLLLWLFFSSAIMIIGAILNAVLHEYFYGRAAPTQGKFYDLGRGLVNVFKKMNQ